MNNKVVHHEVRSGVAVLTIDNPPVNAASALVRRQLLEAIERYSEESNVLAIVIIGAGNVFIAGSDLKEFGLPLEEPQLPVVISAIENSEKPVIAALHGAALGGGLELALGCDARIALRDCQLGLPEVTLGMIPGAGGTQRLPRLIGICRAIEMICQGERMSSTEAEKMGLVDAVVDSELLDFTISFARSARKKRVIELTARAQDRETTSAAVKKVSERARVRPAELAAVESILNSILLPAQVALEEERKVFQELRLSKEAAALRYQFFAERRAGKLEKLIGVQPRAISIVGVVGGGTMGTGIASSLLDAGMIVVLIEQDQPRLQAAKTAISEIYQQQIARKKCSPAEMEDKLASLLPSLNFNELSNCHLIIEAVYEDVQVKTELMKKLSQVTAAGTVIGTNTSYLNVDAIASAYIRPQDVCGVHFFSPAHIMKLLEIVDADATSASVLATVINVAKKLGKIPVIAKNNFGFIGNRIYASYRRHSEFLIEEGASPYDIDLAMEEFGFALGPFAVADLSGLDIAWNMRKSKAATRDQRERYVGIPDILCELGRFGRKSNAGYYDYKGKSREKSPVVIDIIDEYRHRHDIFVKKFSMVEIQQRLLLAILSESLLVLQSGIAQSASDVDLTLVNGYGFPRWEGGPFYWARSQDPEMLKFKLNEIAEIAGFGSVVADMSWLINPKNGDAR